MKTKVCFRCEVEQPILSFYQHPAMKDGHLGKCKSCTRKDVRDNYAFRREQYREYDKARYAADPVKRTPKPRAPQKARTRWLVDNAVRRGKLVKLPCQVCGDPKSEGHHEDYSKPLDVVWLCRIHHKELHRIP